jgi:hypothetical protein
LVSEDVRRRCLARLLVSDGRSALSTEHSAKLRHSQHCSGMDEAFIRTITALAYGIVAQGRREAEMFLLSKLDFEVPERALEGSCFG